MRAALKYTALVIAGLALGILIQRYGVVGRFIKPIFKKAQHAASGTSSFPKLAITLAEKDWNLLLNYTDSARQTGMIADKYKTDFVAKATYGTDKNQPCEIRLKGDWADHAMREKPSLRVTMGDSAAIMGIQRFSLQHPRTRNYIYEWLFLEAMRAEDILAPRYVFVQLEVNGKSYGSYAFEEHFDKILVENQHRREGPIVKFDESALWQERERHPEMKGDPTGLQSSATAPITVFRDGKVLKDDMLAGEFLAARTLLEGFRDGKYKPAQVFDTTRLATYFALCELLGGRHSSGRWHNLRFYYNPVTARLEPIAYDGDAGKEITDVFGIGSKPADLDLFYHRLFNDTTFFKTYLKKLEYVATGKYLDKLLATTKKGLDSLQSQLAIEYIDATYSTKPFYQNQRSICLALHPKKCVNAYIKNIKGNTLQLEWATVQPLGVEITGLETGETVLQPVGRPTANGILPGSPAVYQTANFVLPQGFAIPKKLKVRYKNTLLGHKGKDKVFNYPRLDESYINVPVAGFMQDEYYCGQGANLKAQIAPPIALGFMVFNRPVTIAPDKRYCGFTQYPQGFLVISDSVSTIKNYEFKNVAGKGLSLNGRNITGSFTFYGGRVIIEDCLFENITSEDALNLIRCNFELRNCTFRNCSSDAFDADFCTGKVINCRVENCVNDGFDISGSRVEFINCTVTNAGDKGVSVGEGSTASITNLTVTKATSGVGVKDLSYTNINNATLTDCKTGLNLYRKKPEFGYAKADAKGVKFINCTKQYATDAGSVVNIKK